MDFAGANAESMLQVYEWLLRFVSGFLAGMAIAGAAAYLLYLYCECFPAPRFPSLFRPLARLLARGALRPAPRRSRAMMWLWGKTSSS